MSQIKTVLFIVIAWAIYIFISVFCSSARLTVRMDMIYTLYDFDVCPWLVVCVSCYIHKRDLHVPGLASVLENVQCRQRRCVSIGGEGGSYLWRTYLSVSVHWKTSFLLTFLKTIRERKKRSDFINFYWTHNVRGLCMTTQTLNIDSVKMYDIVSMPWKGLCQLDSSSFVNV